ncbi:MAG TPA: histidine phosphatase family protein [Anaerolineae bacterium]|nr:histidine phosphatase family protein [Anaerolineae bacterium]
MHLLLIRHGESVANAEKRMQGQFDSPLSDEGRAQARALGRRLRAEGWEIDAIYASDLSRASETAEILGQMLDLPVCLDPRLREYDAGVLNGLTWDEIDARYPDLWREMRASPVWVPIPGEEGPGVFVDRLAALVADVRAHHHDGQSIALVGHGASLGALISHLLGIDTRSKPQPFRLGNASLSLLEFTPRGVRVSRLNDTSHL